MGGKSNTGKEGGSGVSKRGERGNLEGKAEKMNAIAKLAAAEKTIQRQNQTKNEDARPRIHDCCRLLLLDNRKSRTFSATNTC
jgi:hypothetical protein